LPEVQDILLYVPEPSELTLDLLLFGSYVGALPYSQRLLSSSLTHQSRSSPTTIITHTTAITANTANTLTRFPSLS
jgi:hypothetical protein